MLLPPPELFFGPFFFWESKLVKDQRSCKAKRFVERWKLVDSKQVNTFCLGPCPFGSKCELSFDLPVSMKYKQMKTPIGKINRKNYRIKGRSLTIEHFEIWLAVVIRFKVLLGNVRLFFLFLFFLRRFCWLISHWCLTFSLWGFNVWFNTLFIGITGSSLSFLSSLLCFLKNTRLTKQMLV